METGNLSNPDVNAIRKERDKKSSSSRSRKRTRKHQESLSPPTPKKKNLEEEEPSRKEELRRTRTKSRNEEIIPSLSDASHVISSSEYEDEEELPESTQTKSLVVQTKNVPNLLNTQKVNELNSLKSARVNLENLETQNVTKHILITGQDPENKITKINPCKMEDALTKLCGNIEFVEYNRKADSILITLQTHHQVHKIIKTKVLLEKPITIKPHWARSFTYGKLRAPEFSEETMEEMLEYLKPHNVVAVRKLFTNPSKSHIPLYVLTFLGPLPAKIKLGHISYLIDVYVPKPMRCNKCWYLAHTTTTCKNKPACSKCGETSHTRENCNAEKLKCVNCKGEHEASSNKCPKYLEEQRICEITAEQGISFAEARRSLKDSSRTNTLHIPNCASGVQKQNLPNFGSKKQFPLLRKKNNSNYSLSQDLSNVDGTYPPTLREPAYNYEKNNLRQEQVNFSQLTNLDDMVCDYPEPLSLAGNNAWNQSSDQEHYTGAIPKVKRRPQVQESSSAQASSLLNNLLTNIPTILPYIIQIFFANDLNEKIRALIGIGKIVGLEAIVASALKSLNLDPGNGC